MNDSCNPKQIIYNQLNSNTLAIIDFQLVMYAEADNLNYKININHITRMGAKSATPLIQSQSPIGYYIIISIKTQLPNCSNI